MSLDEAQELAELTNRIVSNIKFIRGDGAVSDFLDHIDRGVGLYDLRSTTDDIVENLKFIKDNPPSE